MIFCVNSNSFVRSHNFQPILYASVLILLFLFSLCAARSPQAASRIDPRGPCGRSECGVEWSSTTPFSWCVWLWGVGGARRVLLFLLRDCALPPPGQILFWVGLRFWFSSHSSLGWVPVGVRVCVCVGGGCTRPPAFPYPVCLTGFYGYTIVLIQILNELISCSSVSEFSAPTRSPRSPGRPLPLPHVEVRALSPT